MKKSTRVEKAKETLRIIEQGTYQAGDSTIDVKKQIDDSIQNSHLYQPAALDQLLNANTNKLAALNYDTEITVVNNTVLQAGSRLALLGEKTGCLNFASARNPGGGFLGGAVAQEESLALSSSLYGSLMANFDMYEYNRSQPTLLYSDLMIWSPEVVMFRNDHGELLEKPYTMSIITSPAANAGAIRNTRPFEMAEVPAVMMARTEKVLGLMLHHGMEHLLLGAWGCGVFQNNPADVAAYFAAFLKPGGKYARCFKSVVFAVLDRSDDEKNVSAFKKAFGLQ
ncbi:TIGR02452 family protein [Chitinophaga sp. Cy-1792]|uniref:TIGR02452 family protein n=1 Tax=Chitinophaga sp. Cy-1792 TaxID=2608339 RepID=UPI001423BA86|nr:TIGR02452 family protein [Chitinophaga sp. Cy-1792]NIG55604.1 TIGR02452 family protein [Chitinophaga sp. Cy-1792]